MELEVNDAAKVILCELCGSEAKLMCFCRKASLCETCIGRHLISEPSLPHKPITFSQSEIAAFYEEEFVQLRATEARLMQEVAGRQEFVRVGKGRLMEEIQKVETFKCTCLEYVTVAVEMTKQKLAQAAESIAKDMVETCDHSKRELEDAIRSLELGEPHWAITELEHSPGLFWQGNIDLKEIDLVDVLRRGIEFHLTVNKPKSVRNASQTPAKKAKEIGTKAGQKSTVRTTPQKPTSHKLGKASQSLIDQDLPYKEADKSSARHTRDLDCASPEPPSSLPSRPIPDSPSSLHFGARTALIQQTAKHVSEISDLVKAIKSPRAGEGGANQSLTQRVRGVMPLSELNYSCTLESLGAKTSTHKGREERASVVGMQETGSEEISASRSKPCLYYLPPGTTSLHIHNLESGQSSLRTFPGLDPFPKFTFWCAAPSGEVYIIGGIGVETQSSTVKKACLVYSPLYDTIENGPSLLTARHSCSAICVKETLFVTGGVGGDLGPMKDCEKLDVRTKRWRKIGGLNVARESHALTLHLGRMYVAGGPGEQSMETYNPVNDRWALLHFKVSAGGKACSFSLGDKVAILHDKEVTYAWVDKRTSEHARDLDEKGWWLGGSPLRFGASIYLQRGAAVYQFTADSCDLRKLDLQVVS